MSINVIGILLVLIIAQLAFICTMVGIIAGNVHRRSK
jgi:hypothetical protein